MAELATAAASAVVVAGLLLALAALALTRSPRASLPVFTDLLLAGGLLRLAADPGWTMLATAAAIVVVRRLVLASLRRGVA